MVKARKPVADLVSVKNILLKIFRTVSEKVRGKDEKRAVEKAKENV